MNKIKLIGIKTEGSMRLWYGPETKIGVFASRDFDANDYRLEQWAAENAISVGSREELCNNPLVIEMVLNRISMLQQEFAHYEQVKRIFNQREKRGMIKSWAQLEALLKEEGDVNPLLEFYVKY